MAQGRPIIYGKRGKTSRLLWDCIALAIVLHLAFVPMLGFFVPDIGEGAPRKKLYVVALAPPKGHIKPHKKPTPEIERKKPEQKKEEPPKDLKGQVVDVPPSPDDTPPEDADFLSEHNTRAARQSISRHRSADYRNPMNELSTTQKPNPNQPEQQPEKLAVNIGPDNPAQDAEKTKSGQDTAFEIPDIKERDTLALKLDPELGSWRNQALREAIRGHGDRLRLNINEDDSELKDPGSAEKQQLNVPNLMPELGVLARISGGPANDHVEDIDEGEGTFLNSREFKFAGYFNRMKRGVSQHWRPLPEYRRRDPTGNIYGFRSRTTVLNITLNADGAIRDVSVKQSSGVDFLDREAVSAFYRAQPFPNPPKDLVDSDGRIEFPFGFHLDFNRGAMRFPF